MQVQVHQLRAARDAGGRQFPGEEDELGAAVLGRPVERAPRLEDVTGVQGKPIPAKPAGTDFKLPVTWALPRAADDRNPAFVRLYLKVPDDKDAVMASLALSDKNQRSRLFLLTASGSQAWAATAGAPPSLDGKAMDLDAANAVVDRADAKSAGANLIIFGNAFR